MYRALLYKEWIKLRWVFLLLCGIGLWTVVDLLLSVREYFEFMKPVEVWEVAIRKKFLIYSGMKYVPLIAGVGIALVQFIPETRKRRLRLLFHIPLSHNRSLYFMMAVGLGFTLSVIALNALGLVAILPAYYPPELVRSALLTAAPWFLAGIAAYFATVLVVVEPVWWRRVGYAFLSYLVIMLCYNGSGYDTYAHSLWKYALLISLYFFTVILPAFRFKRGLY